MGKGKPSCFQDEPVTLPSQAGSQSGEFTFLGFVYALGLALVIKVPIGYD